MTAKKDLAPLWTWNSSVYSCVRPIRYCL